MTNLPMTPGKNRAAPYLAANDEMSNAIDTTTDYLARDVGPLTEWRLRRARGREAIKMNETVMVDYMDARRRTFQLQIALEEDYTKKLMLTNSMDQTKTVEKEIARIISEAVAEFESLITGREKLALINEVELINETLALVKDGKIAQRRGDQRISNIEASTDAIVETVQTTIRDMLVNLRSRFNQALQMG